MRTKCSFAIVAILGLLATAATCQADLIPLGSFETPDVADGVYSQGTLPTGWTNSNNNKTTGYGSGIMDPATNPTGIDGSQLLRMYFPYSSSQNQWLKVFAPSQGSVLANTTYTLSVAVGLLSGETQPVWGASGYNEITFRLSNQPFVIRYPTFTAGTLTDLTIQVAVDADGKLASSTFTGGASSSAPAVGTLLTGGTAEIQLMGGRAMGAPTGIRYLEFDNVRLSAVTVPEPGTIALASVLLVVGLALALRRWHG